MCACLVNCLANDEVHIICCSCYFPLFLESCLKIPSNARHNSGCRLWTYASNAQLLIFLAPVYCTLLICYQECITHERRYMYIFCLHDSVTHSSNEQFLQKKFKQCVGWPFTYYLSAFPYAQSLWYFGLKKNFSRLRYLDALMWAADCLIKQILVRFTHKYSSLMVSIQNLFHAQYHFAIYAYNLFICRL